MTFVPYDRPVRAAFIGLGRIYDLNVRAYIDNPDVEVVALVDPSEERCAQRQADWPGACTFASVAELASSGIEVLGKRAAEPVRKRAHPLGVGVDDHREVGAVRLRDDARVVGPHRPGSDQRNPGTSTHGRSLSPADPPDRKLAGPCR